MFIPSVIVSDLVALNMTALSHTFSPALFRLLNSHIPSSFRCPVRF